MNRDERIKQMKYKLQLYGSLTRELQSLPLELEDICTRIDERLGKSGGDPYKPLIQQMQHEKVSIELRMVEARKELKALGLSAALASLDQREKMLVEYRFVKERTLEDMAAALYAVHSTVLNDIQKIIQNLVEITK